MNKELQDLAWSCLTKEFHEEVKKLFEEYKKHPEIHTTCGITTAYHNNMGQRLIDLFGLHNLTSDAEGEEMLTVPRKAIIQAYEKSCAKRATKYDVGYADCLNNLFGSKCLPDEGTDCTPVEVGVAENTTTSNVESLDSNVDSLEPKPAEPRFKVGDKVRIVHHLGEDTPLKGEVCEIVVVDEEDPVCTYYIHNFSGEWYSQSDLEPYTEQEVKRHVSVKEACEILGVDESEATKLVKSEPIETCTDTCTDNCSSPDHFVVKDEMVDNIIKDGFHEHNRLHIASLAMAGLLANQQFYNHRLRSYGCGPIETMSEDGANAAIAISLNLADALISKCKKGGIV